MRPILKLLRIKQWVKNLFVFIPTFFAGAIFDIKELLALFEGALAFSLVASGVYVLNDYLDRPADRLHPIKRKRPLASGDVSETIAIILILVLVPAGLALGYFINGTFLCLLIAYLGINLAYSAGLKRVSILDLFMVASGFLVRIYAGGAIVEVAISHWLAIMVLLLALFLIIAKRRDDLVIQSQTGVQVREASQYYNLEFINSSLTLFAGIVIVAYIMYTVSPEVTERFQSDYIFTTTIFVIAGILRYLQITFVEQGAGSPTSVLLKDRFILATIAGWFLSFYLIIYVA